MRKAHRRRRARGTREHGVFSYTEVEAGEPTGHRVYLKVSPHYYRSDHIDLYTKGQRWSLYGQGMFWKVAGDPIIDERDHNWG